MSFYDEVSKCRRGVFDDEDALEAIDAPTPEDAKDLIMTTILGLINNNLCQLIHEIKQMRKSI